MIVGSIRENPNVNLKQIESNMNKSQSSVHYIRICKLIILNSKYIFVSEQANKQDAEYRHTETGFYQSIRSNKNIIFQNELYVFS